MTREELLELILNNLPDNSTQEITPQDIREVFEEFSDSFRHKSDPLDIGEVGEANYGVNLGPEAIGPGIYRSKNGEALEFYRLKPGPNISISLSNGAIEISTPDPVVVPESRHLKLTITETIPYNPSATRIVTFKDVFLNQTHLLLNRSHLVVNGLEYLPNLEYPTLGPYSFSGKDLLLYVGGAYGLHFDLESTDFIELVY